MSKMITMDYIMGLPVVALIKRAAGGTVAVTEQPDGTYNVHTLSALPVGPVAAHNGRYDIDGLSRALEIATERAL